MEFLNGSKIEDFIDKDVHVILASNSNVCDTLPLCHAFMNEDKLCIDLIPPLNKKYVVEVPENSAFSMNDEELSMGRYGIIIKEDTPAGSTIRSMLEQKRRHEHKGKR